MPISTTDLLDKFNRIIQQLTQNVEKYQHITLYSPCFDMSLFGNVPPKANYQFYLKEINQNYQKLCELIERNNILPCLEAIEYLTQRLINQIEALNRQLANIQTNDEPAKTNQSPQSLYERYNTNLDYLRRLQASKYELELSSNIADKSKIALLNQRIYHCQQAIKQIELEIEQDINN